MAPVLMLLVGLGLGLLGAATALDVISLRTVAHSLDVPLLSGMVIGLREAMPTSMAHALEPALGLAGGLLAVWSLVRRVPSLDRLVARLRTGTVHVALAYSGYLTGRLRPRIQTATTTG